MRNGDPAPASGAFHWPAFLLGFALGGFFDGILLHQILQWHHLLSAVDSAAFRKLPVQILADGLFHALMYLLAALGLWLLWRARRDVGRLARDRRVLADFLIGFGLWHVVDGIVFHWLLGLHRIRMEAENPLFWDLVFFIPGMLLVLAGLALRRRAA
jgi:uncharacterized membrane protein